jgi:hypothetical protein
MNCINLSKIIGKSFCHLIPTLNVYKKIISSKLPVYEIKLTFYILNKTKTGILGNINRSYLPCPRINILKQLSMNISQISQGKITLYSLNI